MESRYYGTYVLKVSTIMVALRVEVALKAKTMKLVRVTLESIVNGRR
jgi:hypothetical protein